MARVAYSEENKRYSAAHDPRDNRSFREITKPLEDRELTFSKSSFNTFSQGLHSHLQRYEFKNLDHILSGIEKLPQLAPGETAQELLERKEIYYARRNLVRSCLGIALSKYVIHQGEDHAFIYSQLNPITDPNIFYITMTALCTPNQSIDTWL